MKNFYLAILFLAIAFSCTKESYEETKTNQSFEINGNQIEVKNNFLKFEDDLSFFNTLEDFYNNKEIYVDFFEQKKPIKNSFFEYEHHIQIIEKSEWDNVEDILDYIKSNETGIVYEQESFNNLFYMDYKNIFCNLDGIIQIGDFVYKYTRQGRYKIASSDFNSKNNFDESSDFENLRRFIKREINNRDGDWVESCTSTQFQRRIIGTQCADVTSNDFGDCQGPANSLVSFGLEAELIHQRKRWYGWVRSRVDELRIDTDFLLQGSNGAIIHQFTDVRISTNASKTSWGRSILICVTCNLNYDIEFEADYRSENNNDILTCDTVIDFVPNASLCL